MEMTCSNYSPGVKMTASRGSLVWYSGEEYRVVLALLFCLRYNLFSPESILKCYLVIFKFSTLSVALDEKGMQRFFYFFTKPCFVGTQWNRPEKTHRKTTTYRYTDQHCNVTKMIVRLRTENKNKHLVGPWRAQPESRKI